MFKITCIFKILTRTPDNGANQTSRRETTRLPQAKPIHQQRGSKPQQRVNLSANGQWRPNEYITASIPVQQQPPVRPNTSEKSRLTLLLQSLNVKMDQIQINLYNHHLRLMKVEESQRAAKGFDANAYVGDDLKYEQPQHNGYATAPSTWVEPADASMYKY